MDERLKRFLGKSKKYTISGEEYEIEPFKGKELDMLPSDPATSKPSDVLRMVHFVMEKHFPGIKLSDVEDLPLSVIEEWGEAINDVNGGNKKRG